MSTQPVQPTISAPASTAAAPTAAPGMTFDAAPVATDTPVTMTFDATPVSKPLVVPAPDPTASQPAAPAALAAPATQPPTYYPPAISAAPVDSTLASKLQTWARNVDSDLHTGSTLTGVGSVLKSMGAHGFDAGVSPGVADFMGSLPLGLLKATKGGAEVAQPGQRVQGAKDVAGGLLDASTIPASVTGAPEAGLDVAAEQASRAADLVAQRIGAGTASMTRPFSTAAVQADLQAGLRKVLGNVAIAEKVSPADSSSIRDVAGKLSDAILARSSAAYKAMDEATGGRVQRFADALKNIDTHLRENAGLMDNEQEQELLGRKDDIEHAMNQAFDEARAKGVDPAIVDKARADWAKGSALGDLDRQMKYSTSGLRPELSAGSSTPETVDAAKLFTRANRLFDNGRLQTALGSQAPALLQEVDAAHLTGLKIANRIKTAKTIGKVAAYGAGAAGLGEAVHAVRAVTQ